MRAGIVETAVKDGGVASGFQAIFADIDKSDEGLASVFATVDTDGSGKISAAEMAAYVKKIGESADEATMAAMSTPTASRIWESDRLGDYQRPSPLRGVSSGNDPRKGAISV